MGGLFGGSSIAKQSRTVGSLQFQSSQRGGVIPLVYGTTRVTPNLLDYDDFKATPAKSSGGKGKGGGGGKGGGQQTNYSASVIFGVCQGPIAGFGAVWWDKNIGTVAGLPSVSSLNLGADGQAADGFWASNHAAKALGYSGTATVVLANYQLGNTATLPNFSFEVKGVASTTGLNGLDANPAAIIADFLVNPRYGAGFPAANLGDLTPYRNYCQALGIMLSPLIDAQQEAQQHLSDIVKITNSAIVWSGGLLKIVPYGDQPLSGNGANFTPSTVPVYGLGEDDFIVQSSSVGGNTGVGAGGAALRTGASPVTGGFSDDPVHIARSTPADATSSIQLEVLDRGSQYNTAIVEASDQAAIDLYGIRRDSSLKARAIVDPNVGALVAQLLLQRALLFRNTYSFKLGWKYCLLEPMDVVQITDARLGAYALSVRITGVEEDDEGTLTITAEDFFGAYSPAVLYPPSGYLPAAQPSILGLAAATATPLATQPNTGGYVPNWNSDPGNVNPPVIFQPPSGLVSNDVEIWVALSGGPNWGGAQVWVSSGGDSYAYAGTVNGPATQGYLTATLPSHSSPDTVDTLSVDLTESRGQLVSVSPSDAQNLVTLCWVDGELIAFQTATLTAAYKYGLTTLYRGCYGSTISSHAAGAQFARLDGLIGRFPIPSSLVGQTIYLKFLSFNTVQGGLQNLANVPAYAYVAGGSVLTPTLLPHAPPEFQPTIAPPRARRPDIRGWRHDLF